MHRMRTWLIIATAASLACSAGCTDFRQARLSPYADIPMVKKAPIAQLYRDAGLPTAATDAQLPAGSSIAVATLGAPTPPTWMIEALKQSHRFSQVTPVAGGGRRNPPTRALTAGSVTPEVLEAYARLRISEDVHDVRAALDVTRANAATARCNYALAVAHESQGRWQQSWGLLFDIVLLFPLYVVPDQKAVATASAQVWLIDVRSGDIVRCETVDADSWRLGTTAGMKDVVKLAIDAAERRLAERIVQCLLSPPQTF
jgi:hypothetical protein